MIDSGEKIKGTPKDIFLHLLAVATLYVSVVAFIALWWNYIDVIFPDFLKYQGYYGGTGYAYDPIRWAMAALIVVFPIHILISWLIGRDFKSDPEKREMRARKWLWYIILFVSAITIMIDLVILVNNFLKGDLTIQFFLKIIVVLAVAATVFTYYLWDLKTRQHISGKPKLIAIISSLIILSSIIYGFFLIGSPATQRTRRFDDQRVNDLSTIQGLIVYYWEQNKSLPQTLDDLGAQSSFLPTDPESKTQYEYVKTGQLTYKLCAIFSTSSIGYGSVKSRVPMPLRPVSTYPYEQTWEHDEGRVCFEHAINPEQFKLQPQY